MSDEDKTKSPGTDISLAPSVTALLKPSADYLGGELREVVKKTTEKLKVATKEKNLKAHIDAVQKKLEKQPPEAENGFSSVRQLNFFDEWAEVTQNIDPADKELSEMWRNLMARAVRQNDAPEEIVEILKKVTPQEALFLSQRFLMPASKFSVPSFLDAALPTYSSKEKFLATALQNKAVLNRSISPLMSAILVFGLYILLSFVADFFGTESPLLVDIVAKHSTLSVFVAVIFVPAMSIALLSLARGSLFTWQLTWAGRQLVSLTKQGS